MSFDVLTAAALPTDAAVIGVLYGKSDAGAAPLASADTQGIDPHWLSSRSFDGGAGQSQQFVVDGRTVVAVGIGKREDASIDTFRRAAALLVRAGAKAESIAVDCTNAVPEHLASDAVAQALTEGAVLANYRFTAFKSKPDAATLSRLTLVGVDGAGVRRGNVVAKAVCLARDLINSPAGAVTPTRLAEVATSVAEEHGLGLTVLDEQGIEAERLGGLRGVSAGSDEEARLIELTYEPVGGYDATVALVGKGITFDSGGLSLKPAEGMMTMKTDMSGAAAVIATMSTLTEIAPRVRVVGIVCATENLPGPKATKPGDVLTARNGKTMEVLNTDAEGRLVLADGLSLAVESGAEAIIDVATLTGACMVALGNEIAGLMSNDDTLRERVEAAALVAGEQVWHLPLPQRYRKHIDSDVADIKNIGAPRGAAGALTAGLFLQEFVDEKPWVHLDIAGPARADSDDAHIVKGGTGFGVRTLVELVRTYQPV